MALCPLLDCGTQKRGSFMRRRLQIMVVLTGVLLVWACPSPAQILFQDDFSGSILDTSKWSVGNWQLGRTQLGLTPTVTGGMARLEQDTYNASSPGTLLSGTEIYSNQNFA